MMARKAQQVSTASDRLEELTSAELTEVGGGFGYGGGYGYRSYGYGFPYRRMMPYGGVPFYGRPRYHRFYFPYA
jgi:hypothetical protein